MAHEKTGDQNMVDVMSTFASGLLAGRTVLVTGANGAFRTEIRGLQGGGAVPMSSKNSVETFPGRD